MNGFYVTAGRFEAWNEFTYHERELAIHPAEHRYSKLHATYIHNVVAMAHWLTVSNIFQLVLSVGI